MNLQKVIGKYRKTSGLDDNAPNVSRWEDGKKATWAERRPLRYASIMDHFVLRVEQGANDLFFWWGRWEGRRKTGKGFSSLAVAKEEADKWLRKFPSAKVQD